MAWCERSAPFTHSCEALVHASLAVAVCLPAGCLAHEKPQGTVLLLLQRFAPIREGGGGGFWNQAPFLCSKCDVGGGGGKEAPLPCCSLTSP